MPLVLVHFLFHFNSTGFFNLNTSLCKEVVMASDNRAVTDSKHCCHCFSEQCACVHSHVLACACVNYRAEAECDLFPPLRADYCAVRLNYDVQIAVEY